MLVRDSMTKCFPSYSVRKLCVAYSHVIAASLIVQLINNYTRLCIVSQMVIMVWLLILEGNKILQLST